jgi:hypothetical protein
LAKKKADLRILIPQASSDPRIIFGFEIRSHTSESLSESFTDVIFFNAS